MGDRFGLSQADLKTIVSVLSGYPSVKTAVIFGSRAKGNYKTGSDVDIALHGENMGDRVAADVAYQLNEETIMPYKFDVLNYHMIANSDLIAHIDRVGRPFYTA